MNNTEKDIYYKILYDQLDELSSEEKVEIENLFSNEQEFLTIKNVLQTAKKINEEQNKTIISPKIKNKLDLIFENENKRKVWFNTTLNFLWNNNSTKNKKWFNQNLIRIAAILIIIIITIPFLQIKEKDVILNSSNYNSNKVNSQDTNIKPELIQQSNPINQELNFKKENYNYKKQTLLESEIIENDIKKDKKMLELPSDSDIITSKSQNYEAYNSAGQENVPMATFSHPDGIYDEDSNLLPTSEIIENQMFSVKNNIELLNYLKPCY